MAVSSQEDEFLEAAVAAIPRIAELIAALPSEDRAGALEVAGRRFLQSAGEFGCAESGSQDWTAAVMRILQEPGGGTRINKAEVEKATRRAKCGKGGPRSGEVLILSNRTCRVKLFLECVEDFSLISETLKGIPWPQFGLPFASCRGLNGDGVPYRLAVSRL